MAATTSNVTTTTTMPSWYSDAQKNIASGVSNTISNIPAVGNLSATGFEKTLAGDQNPYKTAIGGLTDIMGSATNAFSPNGQINPNSQLGGLFASQYAKLDQMLPTITAKEGAAGIGSGNYMGLRGQTATETAKAGALTTLAEQQHQAALNALTQGTQAGTALGNVGNQYGTSAINSSNWSLSGGLPAYTAASTALGNIGPYLNKDSNVATKGNTIDNFTKAVNFAKNLGLAAGDIAAGRTGVGWLDSMLKSGSKAIGDVFSGSGTSGTENGMSVDDYLWNAGGGSSYYNTSTGPTEADVINSDAFNQPDYTNIDTTPVTDLGADAYY